MKGASRLSKVAGRRQSDHLGSGSDARWAFEMASELLGRKFGGQIAYVHHALHVLYIHKVNCARIFRESVISLLFITPFHTCRVKQVFQRDNDLDHSCYEKQAEQMLLSASLIKLSTQFDLRVLSKLGAHLG